MCGVETWNDMETVLNMYMSKLRRKRRESKKKSSRIEDEKEEEEVGDLCEGVFIT